MSKPLYSPDFFRQIQDIWNRLTNIERTLFNSGVTGEANLVPVGVYYAYSGSTAPNGYLLCDGSEVSRIQYANLFAVIGEIYGDGDTSTTFNLPDFRGRTPVGLNSSNTDIDSLSENDGVTLADRSPKHQLTTTEMPSHSHPLGPSNNPQTFTPAGAGNWIAASSGGAGTGVNPGTVATGGDGKHDHGFQVVNFIIKY